MNASGRESDSPVRWVPITGLNRLACALLGERRDGRDVVPAHVAARVTALAKQWTAHGFTAQTVRPWMELQPADAALLAGKGLTPELMRAHSITTEAGTVDLWQAVVSGAVKAGDVQLPAEGLDGTAPMAFAGSASGPIAQAAGASDEPAGHATSGAAGSRAAGSGGARSQPASSGEVGTARAVSGQAGGRATSGSSRKVADSGDSGRVATSTESVRRAMSAATRSAASAAAEATRSTTSEAAVSMSASAENTWSTPAETGRSSPAEAGSSAPAKPAFAATFTTVTEPDKTEKSGPSGEESAGGPAVVAPAVFSHPVNEPAPDTSEQRRRSTPASTPFQS